MSATDPLLQYALDFYPNKEKVVEAILFLMGKRARISQYPIVKAIFFADRKHLNEAGSPITYDKYVAMRQGPVPSLVYDILKQSANFQRIYGAQPPWTFIRGNGGAMMFEPSRPYDANLLSRSEIAALQWGLDEVLRMSSTELENALHDDKAYKEAWNRRGDSGSVPMNAVLLLDNEDAERIELLSYATYP